MRSGTLQDMFIPKDLWKRPVLSLAVAERPASLLPDLCHTPCSLVSQAQLVEELKGQETSNGETESSRNEQ